jgi:DNA-binding CsgD family transcriptional regulator
MNSSSKLNALIQSIVTAQSEPQLRSRFMDGAGELLGASAWGISLQNPLQSTRSIEATGVPDTFHTQYQKFGLSTDPVLQFVIEHHAPAHQQLVMTPTDWQRSAIYQHVYAPYDLLHMMKGPIIGGGKSIGNIQFSRVKKMLPFANNELTIVSGLCIHLSARIAELRSELAPPISGLALSLTQRERQIAALVAQGLGNIEIGATLQIAPGSVKQALKRMFRKLSVSSRTHLVAKLQGNLLAIEQQSRSEQLENDL